MKTAIKIGLSILSGIGIGAYLSLRKKEEVTIDESSEDTYMTSASSCNCDSLKPIPLNWEAENQRQVDEWEELEILNLPDKKPSGIDSVENWHNYKKWYSWLREEFDIVQVTITNTTPDERTVTLWGGNKGANTNPPLATDVEDHEVISTVVVAGALGVGVHPQGMIVNPANGFVYVANQLSNNVSVVSPDGSIIAIIQLQPSSLPGYNSPVAVAVNTDAGSSNYGKVYVAGSVANTISVIDLNHQVSNEIPVGARPVSVAFNPVNDSIYVSNIADNTVSVIDANSESVSTTLNTGASPYGIGVNPLNGDVFVTNSDDNQVEVFTSSNVLQSTIGGVGVKPVSVIYHPVRNEMFVVAAESNAIFSVNPFSYAVDDVVAVGSNPFAIIYNQNNDFLYIGNRDDDTYTVVDSDNNVEATIDLGPVNIGLAINQQENILFSSDTATNTLNIIGYAEEGSSVSIDDNYQQANSNFQINPAWVKHVKWVLSGEERFKILKIREEQITGKVTEIPLSLTRSPQNYLNVAEAFKMEGERIDGKHSWIFKIAGFQTISMLVYYRQLERDRFLPKGKIMNHIML